MSPLLRFLIIAIGSLLLLRIFDLYRLQNDIGLRLAMSWALIYLAIGTPLFYWLGLGGETDTSAPRDDIAQAWSIGATVLFGTMALIVIGYYLSGI